MKFEIKITNYDKFLERVSDEHNELIFNQSYVRPIIDGGIDDDNRDTNILELLTDDYSIELHTSDIDDFIDMVENDNSVICDISGDNENNKFISHRIFQLKELEKYTEEYILSNLDDDCKNLSCNTLSTLPLELFSLYPDKFSWDRISYLELTTEFIDNNISNLNWDILSSNIDEMYYIKYYLHLKLPQLIRDNIAIDINRELVILKLTE